MDKIPKNSKSTKDTYYAALCWGYKYQMAITHKNTKLILQNKY